MTSPTVSDLNFAMFPGLGANWGAGPAGIAPLFIWYLYVYRCDVEILQRYCAGMKRYLEFLAAMATDDIVHFGLAIARLPRRRISTKRRH